MTGQTGRVVVADKVWIGPNDIGNKYKQKQLQQVSFPYFKADEIRWVIIGRKPWIL